MQESADERRYAWRMIRAARRANSDSVGALGHGEVAALLEQALDAGLDRAELIVALAGLGGRLLALCEPSLSEAADDVCLT